MSSNARMTALAARLARHFAAGAAVAAVLPFLATAESSAAVQYTALNLPIPANVDGLYINVETLATGSSGGVTPGWDINPYGGASLTWFNATGTGMMRFPGVTTGSAGSLAVGTIVSSTASYGSGAVTVGTAAGNWRLNSSNYFGFRFIAADGLTHYGWGRFEIGSSISGADRRITELAWETIPGTPIVVGDQGGPPPSYDPCSSANPTLSINSNLLGTNQTTATNLDLSSSSCAFVIRKANFYKFTPPVSGSYTISSCPSGLDTSMAVVTDCANASAPGALLACSAGSSCGASAAITLTLTQGAPVYLVLGSGTKSDLPSTVSVQVTAPAVPACVSATVASFGDNPISNSATNLDQDVKSSADGLATTTIYKAGWFAFTPSVTGAYKFKTCGAASDTRMAIGTVCPSFGTRFQTIAYNDDAPSCFVGTTANSWASWIDATNNGASDAFAGFPLTQDLVAGTTYYICVGGFGASTAPVLGTLTIDGPPQTIPGDFDGDGIIGPQDLAILLGNWGNSGVGDIDGDGTVGASDLTILLGTWSA